MQCIHFLTNPVGLPLWAVRWWAQWVRKWKRLSQEWCAVGTHPFICEQQAWLPRDWWTELNTLVIWVGFCSPPKISSVKTFGSCSVQRLTHGHPPVSSLTASTSLWILARRMGNPGAAWGEVCVVFTKCRCPHTHYTLMFIHILHTFMESSASLFATYSYFLEILKASHLTTNKKSHFPVVNTKAISLPLMNAIGDGSLPMWCRCAKIQNILLSLLQAFLIAQLVKNPPAMQETPVWSLGWEDPWRRERLPTPVFWPGEFHGPYPWGHKELNTTERLRLWTCCRKFTVYLRRFNHLSHSVTVSYISNNLLFVPLCPAPSPAQNVVGIFLTSTRCRREIWMQSFPQGFSETVN